MDLKVILLPFRHTGSGMSVYPINLARALTKGGAEVKLFGFGEKPIGLEPFDDVGYESIGKDPQSLDLMGGVATTHWYIRKRLLKVLRQSKEHADIFHFISPGATVRPLSAQDSSIITSAWGFSSPREIIRDAHRKFSRKWIAPGMIAELQFYYMDLSGLNKSNGIICTTRKAQEFWQRRVRALATYLPLPVEIPCLPREAPTAQDESNNVTFMVGERELERPRNNVRSVLDSFRLLHSKGSTNFELHLVGKYGSVLQSTVNNLRRMGMQIFLHSYLSPESYVHLLGTIDVCIISRYIKDQGGYWPLEAMARGIPVISSDMPAFRDFVLDGKNGLLVDPYSPENISSKIQLVLGDRSLLNTLKLGAQRFIRHYHALEVVGPQYLDVYQRTRNEVDASRNRFASEARMKRLSR